MALKRDKGSGSVHFVVIIFPDLASATAWTVPRCSVLSYLTREGFLLLLTLGHDCPWVLPIHLAPEQAAVLYRTLFSSPHSPAQAAVLIQPSGQPYGWPFLWLFSQCTLAFPKPVYVHMLLSCICLLAQFRLRFEA